jgi:hypothetical protein
MHRPHSLTAMIAGLLLLIAFVIAAFQTQRSLMLRRPGTGREAISDAAAANRIRRAVTAGTSEMNAGRSIPGPPLSRSPTGLRPETADAAADHRGALILLLVMAQGPKPLSLGW